MGHAAVQVMLLCGSCCLCWQGLPSKGSTSQRCTSSLQVRPLGGEMSEHPYTTVGVGEAVTVGVATGVAGGAA